MNTTDDNWIYLCCGQCKHFNVSADLPNVEGTCKRLDHKHLRFAKKLFKCYDCGQTQGNICSDFTPRKGIPYLNEHWHEIKHQIIPYKDSDVVALNIDGDDSIRYAVSAKDFYNGTLVNTDGSLRWLYRYYHKQSRKSVTGWKTVYEYNDCEGSV